MKRHSKWPFRSVPETQPGLEEILKRIELLEIIVGLNNSMADSIVTADGTPVGVGTVPADVARYQALKAKNCNVGVGSTATSSNVGVGSTASGIISSSDNFNNVGIGSTASDNVGVGSTADPDFS